MGLLFSEARLPTVINDQARHGRFSGWSVQRPFLFHGHDAVCDRPGEQAVDTEPRAVGRRWLGTWPSWFLQLELGRTSDPGGYHTPQPICKKFSQRAQCCTVRSGARDEGEWSSSRITRRSGRGASHEAKRAARGLAQQTRSLLAPLADPSRLRLGREGRRLALDRVRAGVSCRVVSCPSLRTAMGGDS